MTGNSGTLSQTISTDITKITASDTSAQEYKNRARDTINIAALPVDV